MSAKQVLSLQPRTIIMSIIDKIKSLFSGGKSSSTTKTSGAGYEGVVKKFQYKKGFGFISSTDLDNDVFVHFSEADFKIQEGNIVSFKIEETEKGPRAVEVKFIAKGKPVRRKKKYKKKPQ